MVRFNRAVRGDDGASSVEYGILIAAVAAVILLGVVAVGREVSASMATASSTLGATSGQLDAMAAAAADQPPAAPAADTSGQEGTEAGTSGGSAESGADPSAEATDAPAPRMQALSAADWSVLSGAALVNGTSVQTTRGANVAYQNTSVMNATPWQERDITLTSTMRLILPAGVSGYGYGLWLRATPNASTRTVPSGYSFQVDPGAGNRFVLKLWDSNGETTLAQASFPSGFNPVVDNDVSVTMVGDTFVALVNGTEVLRVNSVPDLAQARGQTLNKTLTLPTGTQYGLRAWQKADAVMTGTMVGPPAT